MIQIANVTCSDDADFHRGMMDKAEAMTMMTRWTYQHYFNTKRYVALDFCDSSYIPQLHMVVYRKDAKQEVHDIIAMIRREMHIK